MENQVYGKKEFVNRYAEDQEITKKDAAVIYDTVFATLADILAEGHNVAIPGLGKFEITERGARTARNPQDGTEIEVPAHNVLRFKPSKAIKEAVK